MGAQLASIQVLRAAAALLVLFGHLWAEYAALGVPDAFPNFIAGAAGVDLFFVISGFVMVYSSERFYAQPGGSVRFFLRRLIRIVPLYWLTTTIVLLVTLRRGTLDAADLSESSVLASYLFFPAARPSGATYPLHSVGWTLNCEMFFYLLFALAVMLPRRAAVVTTCLFLSACVVARAVDAPMPYYLWFFGHPIVLEFAYGAMIGYAFRTGVRMPTWASVAGVCLAIGAYAGTWSMAADAQFDGMRHILWGAPAALVVACVALSRFKTSVWTPLVLLGDASYALYLTHTIVMPMVRHAFARVLHATSHPYIFIALEGLVAIGAAILVYRYFERPTTNFLKSRQSVTFQQT